MPTRRRVLQYGMVMAAGMMPTGRAAAGTRSAEISELVCRLPTAEGSSTAVADVSPHVQRLVIPATASPASVDAGVDRYEIAIRETDVHVLPGQATRMLTYGGTWPGPTIRATAGRPVSVRFTNEHDAPTVVHLHGAHTGPAFDGHPVDEIAPGGSRLYRYPNGQPSATLWYHDHAMHRTGEHVYRGLAGFYLLHDPADDSLGLPGGDRDLPLLLQDRRFAADNQLVYDHNGHSGAMGDVVCVNGVPHPHHPVEATSYRLRLLNGANSRIYRLRLDGDLGFQQIASDGGLLAASVARDTVTLAPAERVDVIVDFSSAAGTTVHLIDDAAPIPTILRFDVAAGGPATSSVPPVLASLPVLAAPAVTRDVVLNLDRTGRWQLNSANFDPGRIDFRPRLGATERWRFTNTTSVSHPVHLHLVQFRVQSRHGAPVGPEEQGWKDTVLVPGKQSVEVLAQFTGHTGTYVYHCHNLEHEDHDMMAQFRVVDLQRLAGKGRVETAAAISEETFSAGVPVAFVATAGGFADALTGGPVAALLGGPVLLTVGESLPAATAGELRRLAPRRIMVLGGHGVVPASVERDLAALTEGEVDRLAGSSRFATAAAISRFGFPSGADTVYIATGAGFPDALAGGAAAAAEAAPVLLVASHDIPADTARELSRLGPRSIRVLGGTAAVSDAVLASLRNGSGAQVERLAGPSRFETATRVSAAVWPDGAETVVVSTGGDFPDALAGVPAAAAAGAPLLLVTRDSIPAPVMQELARLDPSRILILGGPGAVSESVQRQLDGFLEG